MSGLNNPAGRVALRTFAPAIYFLAALLVVVPLSDLLLNVWPARFSDPGWRYGTVGLAGQFLHTPLLGLLLAALCARFLEQRWPLRLVGTLCVLAALLGLGAIGSFTLDAVQIRASVEAAALAPYDAGVVRALAKHVTGAIAFVLIGTASFRAARQLRAPAPAGRKAGEERVLVGRRPARATG